MPENNENRTQKHASVENGWLTISFLGLHRTIKSIKEAQLRGYTATIPLIAATVVGIGGLLWLLQAAYDPEDLFNPEVLIPGFVYLGLCMAGAWLIARLICWQIEALRRKEPPKHEGE